MISLSNYIRESDLSEKSILEKKSINPLIGTYSKMGFGPIVIPL